MLETQLAAATAKIVLDVLDKVTGGALEEIGVQILRYLKSQFQGTVKLEEAKSNPDLLTTVILDKAIEDNNFKNNLEQLVIQYQKLENNNAQVIQKTNYGVNIANSNNVVGQQFFRHQ